MNVDFVGTAQSRPSRDFKITFPAGLWFYLVSVVLIVGRAPGLTTVARTFLYGLALLTGFVLLVYSWRLRGAKTGERKPSIAERFVLVFVWGLSVLLIIYSVAREFIS